MDSQKIILIKELRESEPWRGQSSPEIVPTESLWPPPDPERAADLPGMEAAEVLLSLANKVSRTLSRSEAIGYINLIRQQKAGLNLNP